MTVLRVGLLLLLITGSMALAEEPPRNLSRREFIERLSTIQAGMPAERVKEILGAPDDIQKAGEVRQMGRRRGQEFGAAWCYGTSGHLSLATLGQVQISTENTVIANPVIADVPLPPANFDEAEMRKLLHQLDDITGGKDFQPQSLIAAVNALQPLGTEKALAVIEEYARIGRSRERFDMGFKMAYLVQVLFGYERLLVEVKIVDDVPFVPGILGGYSGPSEQGVTYIACKNIRVRALPIRAKPLEPTTNLARLREDAMKMAAADPTGQRAISRVDTQFEAIIKPILPRLMQETGDPPTLGMYSKLDKVPVRWDAATNRYVLAEAK